MNSISLPRWMPVNGITNDRFRVASETMRADFIATVPIAHVDCHFALSELDKDIANLHRAMARERKSEITVRKNEADAARDSLTLFGIERMRADQRHFDPAHRAAADRLMILVEKREASLQELAFDENTSQLDQLIADLESPAATADLATLGLSEWFTSLKTAATAFKTVREEERIAEAAEDTPLLNPTKRTIAQRFHLLFTLAQQYAEAGQQPWVDLLSRCDDTVAELKRYRNKPEDPDPGAEPAA